MTQGLKLTKDAPLSLKKAAPGLNKLRVELSWEKNPNLRVPVDVDISAIALTAPGASGRPAVIESHLVFFGQLASADGLISNPKGDNRTGAGDGPDELLVMALNDLFAKRSDVAEIAIWATIDRFAERGHNFGALKDADVKFVNDETGEQLCFIDLDAEFNSSVAVHVASLVRSGDGYELRNVGLGQPNVTFEDVLVKGYAYGQ